MKLLRIYSCDLSNVASISILGNMRCWQNTENMLLTQLSFVSNILSDCNNPGRPYWTSSILCVFPRLNPWLISFSWSFRSFNVTSSRTLNKYGFLTLKHIWALNKLLIVSNLHHKEIKTINKNFIQTFYHTLEVQIIHKP
jgi:hypothetical protein